MRRKVHFPIHLTIDGRNSYTVVLFLVSLVLVGRWSWRGAGLATFGRVATFGGGVGYFRGVATFGIYYRQQFFDVTFGGNATFGGWGRYYRKFTVCCLY